MKEYSSVQDLIKAVVHQGITEAKLTLPPVTKANSSQQQHDIKLLGAFLGRDNCHLTALDLSGNSLGSEGGRVIREALPHNHSLKTLNISRTNLGARETALIAGSMSGNAQLQHLQIAGNIPARSENKAYVEAMFGQMVKSNTTLRTLDISGNHLGGGDLFTAGLAQNTTLRSVNAEGNSFSPKNAAKCTELAQTSKENLPLRIIHNAITSPNISNDQLRITAITKALVALPADKYRAFLQTPNEKGQTPLQEIIATHEGTRAIALMQAVLSKLPEREQTATLQATNAKNENLLHDAARKGDVTIAKFLIEKGVDATLRSKDTSAGTKFVNSIRGKGASPADTARANGNYAMSKILQDTKELQQGRSSSLVR